MMGFLYINTQDPDRSFKAFVKIMDKFLKGLFDNEFKLLKLYFFKFTRILELYAPDLAQHFKVKNLMKFEKFLIFPIERESGAKFLYSIMVYHSVFKCVPIFDKISIP